MTGLGRKVVYSPASPDGVLPANSTPA